MKTSTISLKGGSKVHNKYEGLWAEHYERIQEATLTSPNLKNVFACFISSSSKAFLKREKVKENESK
jgi:hypothetical protein